MLDAIPVVDHRIHHYQTPQGKDVMYHRSHLPDCVLSSRTTRLLREMSHLPDRVFSSRTTRLLREMSHLPDRVLSSRTTRHPDI